MLQFSVAALQAPIVDRDAIAISLQDFLWLLVNYCIRTGVAFAVAVCAALAWLDYRHVVLAFRVAFNVQQAQVAQLLPPAVVVAERRERLIGWIDERELVETLGLLRTGAPSVDETALVSVVCRVCLSSLVSLVKHT